MDLTADAHDRMHEFFERRIGRHLRHSHARASFASYARGILSEGERKSAEPIAARLSANPEECQRIHDRLLYFLGHGTWSDRHVRREAARYAVEALQEREPVTVWIIDDTGFLKQGTHSVGVQRQYTGSAGKTTNCQVAVSLSVATRTDHVPIDFALYLPRSWTDDPARRKEARIPENVIFQTKIELAMDLILRAIEDGVPGDVVLADAAYGTSFDFREVVRMHGLDFAVAVQANTSVWLLDAAGRRRGEAVGVGELGVELGPKAFRRLTWRNGTKSKMQSRFCFRRVKVAHEDGTDAKDREPLWVILEWPEGEAKPTKFVLTSLPRRMTKKQIVRIVQERWRTERAYEDLKGELGLDHFEGRSYPGWNHHVSVVLSCYAFIVAERVRRFPPSAGRARQRDALRVAA